MTGTAVTNSTCLIGLERIERLDILPQVFDTVFAPPAVAIGYYSNHLVTAAVLPFRHLVAYVSDTLTKKGVQLFYPAQFWAVAGSNPRRRLKTGGADEYWVLAIAFSDCC